MRMNRKIVYGYGTGVLLAGILNNTVMAGEPGKTNVAPSLFPWVVSVSAGPVWARGGESQTFFLAPDIEKTYAADKSSNGLFYGEIFLGLQKSLVRQFQGQIGVAVAATGDADLSGEIWDDADPQFNNYAYNYKLSHSHIALKGKLLAGQWNTLIPWISGSIGAGFNRAHEFHNRPTIFEALANPDFASHTKTAFTYTVGAGVQKVLNNHWQAGVGYEFADWGKSELYRAESQTLNSGLAMDHLRTNGLLFNITYIA
ncbi:hypothetical protein Lspi_0943 [Legionella spiritensis]|uniref:Opacity protein and related surface antigens n=2 Tax=Legionella spiritensis TaxID=452 RepID=A0A0W0Z6N5_LEGSP|nr:hypothetical protein Lspi_0943 [Legionella spiritensis]SNV39783.1 Opacity protein and related surface antigens [Legionella spiritensis]